MVTAVLIVPFHKTTAVMGKRKRKNRTHLKGPQKGVEEVGAWVAHVWLSDLPADRPPASSPVRRLAQNRLSSGCVASYFRANLWRVLTLDWS